MARMDTSTLITFNPPCLRVDRSLQDALELLCQWQLTELPVVDRDHRLVGMLQLDEVLARIEDEAHDLSALVSPFVTTQADPFELCRFPRVALQQFVTKRFRTLPVVEDGRLIGTIGRSDFLREFAAGASSLANAAVLDHCVPAGEGLEANASVSEAFEYMLEEGVEHFAVVQSGMPLAACTREELEASIRLGRADELLMQQPQRTRALIELIRAAQQLQPGQSLAEAAQTMLEYGTTALLVVNRARRILGVITESMILRGLLREA